MLTATMAESLRHLFNMQGGGPLKKRIFGETSLFLIIRGIDFFIGLSGQHKIQNSLSQFTIKFIGGDYHTY